MLGTITGALLVGTALTLCQDDILSAYYNLSTKNRICMPPELKSLSGDGIVCSESFRLSIRQSNEHVLMIAPTGQGKSTRFVIPNVNKLKNCSLVVSDPSGEIARTCDTDKKVYILNPFRNDSIGYDPLLNCRSEFEVRKMAKTIIMNGCHSARSGKGGNQVDWIEMALPLVTAYFLYCWHTKKYDFGQVVQNLIIAPLFPPEGIKKEEYYKFHCIQNEILSGKFESPKVEIMAFLQGQKAEATQASIRTVLNSCLQVFLDENIRELFRKPSIDFSKLREEESLLLMQFPERYADYFAPLTATLMVQLIDHLIDSDGLQIYMLLDEFANIGVLPEITSLLAIARKYRVSIVAAVQSVTQLAKVYGEIDGKVLTELFKCILCTGGNKDDSGDYISKLLGSADVRVGGSWVTKPLMTADEVRRMSDDDILIICKNKRPVKDYMLKPIFAKGA